MPRLAMTAPPNPIYAFNLGGGYVFWVTPEDVHVRIHNHEVVKNLYRAHLTSCLEDTPLNVKRIRIKKAQPSAVVLVLAPRKNFMEKNIIGITFVNEYSLLAPDQSPKLLSLAAVQVDQVNFLKRRVNIQRVERTAGDKPTGSLRNVLASPSKRIYIDVLSNRWLSIHNFRVGTRILTNDVEFHFRPVADFIILKWLHNRTFISGTLRESCFARPTGQ